MYAKVYHDHACVRHGRSDWRGAEVPPVFFGVAIDKSARADSTASVSEAMTHWQRLCAALGGQIPVRQMLPEPNEERGVERVSHNSNGQLFGDHVLLKPCD